MYEILHRLQFTSLNRPRRQQFEYFTKSYIFSFKLENLIKLFVRQKLISYESLAICKETEVEKNITIEFVTIEFSIGLAAKL